jgi:hypothetical protein
MALSTSTIMSITTHFSLVMYSKLQACHGISLSCVLYKLVLLDEIFVPFTITCILNIDSFLYNSSFYSCQVYFWSRSQVWPYLLWFLASAHDLHRRNKTLHHVCLKILSTIYKWLAKVPVRCTGRNPNHPCWHFFSFSPSAMMVTILLSITKIINPKKIRL